MAGKYSRPEGYQKVRSTLKDIDGIQGSILDDESSSELTGTLKFKGLEAGEGVVISIQDADNNKFTTTEKKLTISSPGAKGAGINVGSGTKVFKDRQDGINYRFRTLTSGSNAIVLTENNDTIEIDVNRNVLTSASNLSSTGEGIFAQKLGADLQFKKLVGGSNVTLSSNANEIFISAVGPDGGENNTISNVGSGVGIYKTKTGSNLELKTITSSGSIVFTENTNTISLDVDPSLIPSITASNIGILGEGIFAQKVGDNLQFKRLVAGTNVSLSSNTEGITINAIDTNTGENNTISNVGLGQGTIFKQKVNEELQLKTLLAGNNIEIINETDTITINAIDTGENNTASNIGILGEGIFAQKVGDNLQFKRLIAGSNVSLSSNTEGITINAIDTNTGENNTISNVGSGVGIYKTKTGSNLELKTITSSGSIVFTENTNTISLDVDPSLVSNTTASNLGTGSNVFSTKVVDDLQFKSLVAGNNITISETTDEITISSDGVGSIIQGPEAHQNLGIISSTMFDIDVSLSTSYNVILANSATVTFSNPPTVGATAFSLWIQQDSVGSRTINFPSSVKWSNGIKPALSTPPNAVDLFVFTTWDNGVTWYGTLGGVDFK